MNLKRYWIKFEQSQAELPFGSQIGIGVTAHDLNDALCIIKEKIFNSKEIPSIQEQIEDVDVRLLDSNHVLPNMGSPNLRGIWFPLGY